MENTTPYSKMDLIRLRPFLNLASKLGDFRVPDLEIPIPKLDIPVIDFPFGNKFSESLSNVFSESLFLGGRSLRGAQQILGKEIQRIVRDVEEDIASSLYIIGHSGYSLPLLEEGEPFLGCSFESFDTMFKVIPSCRLGTLGETLADWIKLARGSLCGVFVDPFNPASVRKYLIRVKKRIGRARKHYRKNLGHIDRSRLVVGSLSFLSRMARRTRRGLVHACDLRLYSWPEGELVYFQNIRKGDPCAVNIAYCSLFESAEWLRKG